MKKALFITFLLVGMTATAQDYARLNLTIKKTYTNKGSILKSTIYLEPIIADNLMAIELLKKSLSDDGFKVVTEMKDAKYILTLSYKDRSDMGCGGRVMKDMKGQIIDTKKDDEIAVVFNFGQSPFEGKCTTSVMKALSEKLKDEILKM